MTEPHEETTWRERLNPRTGGLSTHPAQVADHAIRQAVAEALGSTPLTAPLLEWTDGGDQYATMVWHVVALTDQSVVVATASLVAGLEGHMAEHTVDATVDVFPLTRPGSVSWQTRQSELDEPTRGTAAVTVGKWAAEFPHKEYARALSDDERRFVTELSKRIS